MRLRHVLPCFCFLGVCAFLPGVAEAKLKFGVVDVQRVMKRTPHWKQAVKVLEKDRKAKQSDLETKQKELRVKKEKLDKQKAVADPKLVASEEEKLLQQAQLLTQTFMQTQQQLTAIEQKISQEMLARIEILVRELALAGDYAFVLETGTPGKPNVLYAGDALDLTAQVLTAYKKRFGKKSLETLKNLKKQR